MIDTKNCAKNEVKDTERQYGLPETNEMEAERYAMEDLVAFDSPQDLLGRWFGFGTVFGIYHAMDNFTGRK